MIDAPDACVFRAASAAAAASASSASNSIIGQAVNTERGQGRFEERELREELRFYFLAGLVSGPDDLLRNDSLM